MKQRNRIAVIGAGTIGARHIQAMAAVAAPVDLDVVDPSSQARERALGLLAADGGLSAGTAREFSRIEDLDAAPDLAIIATASRERAHAVQAIVDRGARSLVLEKVLFTRLVHYDAVEDLLGRQHAQAWVNCPRRAYPGALRLAEFIDNEPFTYRVEGQGWGLGCNLVHHLDEFASLVGSADICLDAIDLDDRIVSAKRDGYVEFFGSISGVTRYGHRFLARCSEGAAAARTVSIEVGDKRLTLTPRGELCMEYGAKRRTEPYPMPPQSEMTAGYVTAVLAGRNPGLPDYATASRLHKLMLNAFLGHLRAVQNDDTIDECPVT